MHAIGREAVALAAAVDVEDDDLGRPLRGVEGEDESAVGAGFGGRVGLHDAEGRANPVGPDDADFDLSGRVRGPEEAPAVR